MTMVISDDDMNMLARLGVKPAEPFDWGDEPQMTIDEVTKPKHPAYADAPLSGLDSLKKIVQDKNNGKDNDEKNILQSLLKDANVDISAPVPSVTPINDPERLMKPMEQALMGDKLRDKSIKGLSDRAVAELTVESRTSLFGSILRLFDMPKDGENPTDGIITKKDSSGVNKDSAVVANAGVVGAVTDPMIMKEPILSTAEIVRSVHLTVQPGSVPAGMDSKEYTMAVLYFLGSYVPSLHEDESEYRTDFSQESQEGWDQLRRTLPVLPLIKATNPGESLEHRCYGRVRPLIKLGRKERKQYPDSMDRDQEFRKKVLNLERMYSSSLPFSSPSTTARLQSKLSSSSSTSSTHPISSTAKTEKTGNDLPFAFQRYVPRRKLVPHIEGGAKEELTLMISGHMQQPQHTPGPKPKAAKSKAAASGPKTAPTTVKSASPAGTAGITDPTNPSTVPEKGAVDSFLTPSKRKGDATVDGLLHLSKKGKEFTV
ncbi:hypothetical protein ACHAXR_010348 [Thalassiosira sp. AJA248-18]